MKNNIKKVFVSCGEVSGDLHLSYIIEDMLKKNKNIEFHGVVGKNSITAGAIEVNNIKNNDIMGFIEVIKKYKYFKKKAYEYVNYIKENDINSVIFVDFGGFNLKFFKLLKKELPNIKCIYYIPPKVWAWGKKRINILKKFDDVIVIFPFEKKYFDKKKDQTGLNVKYFGNPLVDKYNFLEKYGDEILLLPGSRKQEIKKFLPILTEYINLECNKNKKFLLKLIDKTYLEYIKLWNIDIYNILLENNNINITYESLNKIGNRVKYAIATSGTVTFEMFLMGIPTIVVYSTSNINAFIARKILNIKYITLVNINSNSEIFPELLQENFNCNKIVDESRKIEEKLEEIKLIMKKEKENYGEIGTLEKIGDYLLEIL